MTSVGRRMAAPEAPSVLRSTVLPVPSPLKGGASLCPAPRGLPCQVPLGNRPGEESHQFHTQEALCPERVGGNREGTPHLCEPRQSVSWALFVRLPFLPGPQFTQPRDRASILLGEFPQAEKAAS